MGQKERDELLTELHAKCSDCRKLHLSAEGFVPRELCDNCSTRSIMNMLNSPYCKEICWNKYFVQILQKEKQ